MRPEVRLEANLSFRMLQRERPSRWAPTTELSRATLESEKLLNQIVREKAIKRLQ